MDKHDEFLAAEININELLEDLKKIKGLNELNIRLHSVATKSMQANAELLKLTQSVFEKIDALEFEKRVTNIENKLDEAEKRIAKNNTILIIMLLIQVVTIILLVRLL